MTKQLFLGVLIYIAIAILLIAAAHNFWNDGNRLMAFLNIFVAALSIWQAIENLRTINTTKTI